jgi:hypothetical protein
MIAPEFWRSVGGNVQLPPMQGSKARQARDLAFYKEVNDTFTDLLAPYRSINETTPGEARNMVRQVLGCINTATEQYLRADDGRASPTVNSCYMMPILRQDLTDDVLQGTRFVDHTRDLRHDLRAVLQLEEWVKPMGQMPTTFCLPVHDESANPAAHVLSGAPLAFAKNLPQFVDDTLEQRRRRHPLKWWVREGPAAPGRFFLPQSLAPSILDELTAYFEEQSGHMRSFVSVPLPIPPEDTERYADRYADQPLAVLNIQSDQPRLLGRGGARARTLLPTLVPLMYLLIRYISRTHLEVNS